MHCSTGTSRTCERQKHRTNLRGDDSGTHYRVTIFVPFVERVLSQMETRFNNLNMTALFVRFLSLKLSVQEGAQGKLEQFLNFYERLFSLFTLQQIKENLRFGAAYKKRNIG